MNFKYDELKSIFARSFSSFTGWSQKAVEELIINPKEGIDFPDLGELAGIEGITFLRYFADDIYTVNALAYQGNPIKIFFTDDEGEE
jgi:hypothetical protein